MTDPTRQGERFADDPSAELDDRENDLLARSEAAGDLADLDARDDRGDRAWDDLDRLPAGATTTVPSPAAQDSEVAADQIDGSAERSAEQPVAADSSFDRVSADDLGYSPLDYPEGEAPPDPRGEPATVDPIAGGTRDDPIEERGGGERGVATYLPPSGFDEAPRRDQSGRTIQRFDLGEIKQVEVEGPATVTITTGGNGLLTVSAVSEDFERIHVMEGRKDVRIQFDGGFMDRKNPVQDITYAFNLTGLTGLKLEKHVDARVDRMDGGTVTVDLKGGSRLEVGELAVRRLEAKLVDKCQLSATGTADRQVIDLSGESVYDGAQVETDRTAVKARDKSQASLRVKTLLRAQAIKQSTVHYAGEHVDLDVHTEDKSEVRNVAAH